MATHQATGQVNPYQSLFTEDLSGESATSNQANPPASRPLVSSSTKASDGDVSHLDVPMTSLDGPPPAELGISYSSATQGHSALTNSTDGTKGTGTFAAVDMTPNQSSQVGQGTRNSSSAAPEHPTVTGTNSTGHESNPKNSHIVSDTYNHQKRRTLVMIPGICMVICFLGFIITVSSGMMQTEPELTWSLLGSFVLFLLILVVMALGWTRKE